MSKIFTSLFVVLAACSNAAVAAEAGSGNKAQTTRMSQCSADAKDKGLKGDARKDFMSQCLRTSGSHANTKDCDAAADEKGLRGTKRQDFVKGCMKSKPAGNVG
jgi:hypothetical protein